jgi:hypothetical protein
MRNLQRVHALAAGLLIAAVVAFTPYRATAQATQERLPPTVLSADPLNEDQIKQVDAFVAAWMNVLSGASNPQAIADARQRLLDPIRSNLTSNSAKLALVQSTAAALKKATNVTDANARLNMLIVAAEIPDPVVVSMVSAGLKDANPAIRYWSAKALAEVGQTKVLSAEDEQAALASLKAVMGDEKSDVALEQMVRAMGALSIPDARKELIHIIDQRVALFLTQPNEGVRIDRKALAQLQSDLTVNEANGQDIKAPLKQLLLATARYVHAVAQALVDDRVPPAVLPHALAMIDTGDEILRFAAPRLDPDAKLGPDLKTPAKKAEYRLLLVNVLDWVGTSETQGVLNRGQIGIPAAELQVRKVGS